VAAVPSAKTRAGIIHALADGVHCVCEMVVALGERDNNVSDHLAKLRGAGLLRAARREANARFLFGRPGSSPWRRIRLAAGRVPLRIAVSASPDTPGRLN
jgi:DNA-binding transcriptional ArsR family regulator